MMFYEGEKLANERWRKQVPTVPLDQQLELDDELRRLDKEDQGCAEDDDRYSWLD